MRDVEFYRDAQPGRVTSPAELERLGLIAPPETFAPLSPARPFSRGTDKWPSYAMCLDKAPRNRDGSGPDRSRADYVWSMIAISWGHGVDGTAARLRQEAGRRVRTEKATRRRRPARPRPLSNAAGNSNFSRGRARAALIAR